MKNKVLPMNLQIFADPAPAGGGDPIPPTNQDPGDPPATPSFDYEKLASLIAGKQSVTEESVLKGYFKQQGLSKEQMEQAIAAFKQQQAANTPNVDALQQQAAQAQVAAKQAQIQSAATMAAVGLGIDAKTIPYVLKMSDLSQVMGEDGKINDETLKNALNKVLEDVPALKPQVAGSTGFMQVGASGDPTQHQQQTSVAQPQTPSKRWNRFNN